MLLFPTLGCGIEEALRDDIPAHDGDASRVQPLARRGLGLRLPGPHLRACRCSRSPTPTPRSPSSSGCSSAARAWCTSGPRRCPTANGTRPLARRPAARPGLGAPRRGRRARSRSTSATAATRRFAGAWGGARLVRAVPAASTCSSKCSSSDRAIHDTIGSWSSTACSTATRRCASPASRTAPTGCTLLVKRLRKQANQTPWVFAEDPLDTIRAARVGHAVLRGGPAQARRPHRRRADPVRLRLAPRRRRSPTRSTSSRSSTRSPTTRSALVMRDNALELLGPSA